MRWNLIRREKSGRWRLGILRLPWEAARPAIYQFVLANLRPDGSLGPDTPALPDEPVDPDKLRWAAGASDGVFKRHLQVGEVAERVKEVLAALEAVLIRAEADSLRRFYSLVIEQSILAIADPLLEELRPKVRDRAERVRELGHWLATRAPDRNAVKFGMALLGVAFTAEDRKVLDVLGSHEEFTLYAAVALGQQVDPPDLALFALAKRVHGWGRIELIERLAETRVDEIRSWLLREGYSNDVMYEYTALICAETGGLLAELEKPFIDAALLHGSAEILLTLLEGDGGPAAGMADYAEGARAAALYLGHLENNDGTVFDVLTAGALRDYADAEGASRCRWTSEERMAIRVRAQAILNRRSWSSHVDQAFESGDRVVVDRAVRAARILGFDLWERLFDRVAQDSDDSMTWHWVSQTEDPQRIARLAAFAEARFDLAALATGPGESLGIGPGSQPYLLLESVLGALAKAPKVGMELVRTAMSSPVVRNRFQALRVLAAWGKENWPVGTVEWLREHLGREPNGKVREVFERVIAGQSAEEAFRFPSS